MSTITIWKLDERIKVWITTKLSKKNFSSDKGSSRCSLASLRSINAAPKLKTCFQKTLKRWSFSRRLKSKSKRITSLKSKTKRHLSTSRTIWIPAKNRMKSRYLTSLNLLGRGSTWRKRWLLTGKQQLLLTCSTKREIREWWWWKMRLKKRTTTWFKVWSLTTVKYLTTDSQKYLKLWRTKKRCEFLASNLSILGWSLW